MANYTRMLSTFLDVSGYKHLKAMSDDATKGRRLWKVRKDASLRTKSLEESWIEW
jgi:hypothetical protein